MAPQLKVTILHARGLKNVANWLTGAQDPAAEVTYNGDTWQSKRHKGAGANASINESCQFMFVATEDTIIIKLVHHSKTIGLRQVSIAEARTRKVVGEAQLEDEKGYGVGTVEYEVEVIGAVGHSGPAPTIPIQGLGQAHTAPIENPYAAPAVRPVQNPYGAPQARPVPQNPYAVPQPVTPAPHNPYAASHAAPAHSHTAPVKNPYAVPTPQPTVPQNPYAAPPAAPAQQNPYAAPTPQPAALQNPYAAAPPAKPKQQFPYAVPGPSRPVQPTPSTQPTAYPDFSTMPEQSQKYPDVPTTGGSSAAMYPDFSTGPSSTPHGHASAQPVPSAPPMPKLSAPPMPFHDRHTPSYHLPAGRHQQHAPSSAAPPPSGYPMAVPGGPSHPPPLSNGPTPPASPPGEAFAPPPPGYPQPKHGASPPNLSKISTGSTANHSISPNMHVPHAWAGRTAGATSARYPQPPAAPGYLFNRSISMPDHPPHRQHASESREAVMSGSPSRVVGAYGLGAYTSTRRQTTHEMPLYHGASSPSGLSPQRQGTNLTRHSTPGYSLYEG